MLQDRITEHISEPGTVAEIHEDTQRLASSVASAMEGIEVSQRDTTNCGKNDSNIQNPTAHTDVSLVSRYHGRAVKGRSSSSLALRLPASDRVSTAQFAAEQEVRAYGSLPFAADWNAEQKCADTTLNSSLVTSIQEVWLNNRKVRQRKPTPRKDAVTFPSQFHLATSRGPSTSSARQDASNIFKARGVVLQDSPSMLVVAEGQG